jgi:hypothetical protein
MNAKLSKAVFTLGTLLVLGSTASMASVSVTRWDDAKFKAIHAGLTQDEVRDLVGRPASVRANERPGVTMWTYNYTDTFGYNTEFDVSFDSSGKVASTDSLRPKF